MRRESLAASIRFAFTNAALEMRDRQSVGAEKPPQTVTEAPLNGNGVIWTRRRINTTLAALGGAAALDGTLAACFAGPTPGPDSYPPKTTDPAPTPSATSSNGYDSGQESATPTKEVRYRETETETEVRTLAESLAYYTVDTYNHPPYGTNSSRREDSYTDNTNYLVPVILDWENRPSTQTDEYSYVVMKATVQDTYNSSKHGHVVTATPDKASIGRQHGYAGDIDEPGHIGDEYTLEYLDHGHWKLTSTRLVDGINGCTLETMEYFTNPSAGQNGFDSDADGDLDTIRGLIKDVRNYRKLWESTKNKRGKRAHTYIEHAYSMPEPFPPRK